MPTCASFCRCTPVYTGIKCCDFSKTLVFTDNNVRDKIRTRDLLVRSQTLYPAELHVHFSAVFSTASMIIDMIYNLLSKKRDQKRQEVYRLRWQKVALEKQLERLKAQTAEKEQSAEGIKN